MQAGRRAPEMAPFAVSLFSAFCSTAESCTRLPSARSRTCPFDVRALADLTSFPCTHLTAHSTWCVGRLSRRTAAGSSLVQGLASKMALAYAVNQGAQVAQQAMANKPSPYPQQQGASNGAAIRLSRPRPRHSGALPARLAEGWALISPLLVIPPSDNARQATALLLRKARLPATISRVRTVVVARLGNSDVACICAGAPQQQQQHHQAGLSFFAAASCPCTTNAVFSPGYGSAVVGAAVGAGASGYHPGYGVPPPQQAFGGAQHGGPPTTNPQLILNVLKQGVQDQVRGGLTTD